MCPLVQVLERRENLEVVVCVTGQHKEMLAQVLNCFGVQPQFNLSIMKANQTLFDITTAALSGMRPVLEQVRPDIVLVHGDTPTTFAVALAAFYLHIPVGHVEAGLRTYDMTAPFPEEFNRQAAGLLASLHFAPTRWARENLLREGKSAASVFVTGNTVIDALKTTVSPQYTDANLEWAKDCRLVLLTAHRRENWGEPLRQIFRAVRRVVDELPDIKVLFPVHPNPVVRQAAQSLHDSPRIRLIDPVDVLAFHNYMARSYLILTDSGGIQEEAPALGKPVLVLRDVTERPEGVVAGTLRLVGTQEESVYENFMSLLIDSEQYNIMHKVENPYGDGHACERIATVLESYFGKE